MDLEVQPGTTLVHTGNDYAGVQLMSCKDDCSADLLRGADIGQDLYQSC